MNEAMDCVIYTFEFKTFRSQNFFVVNQSKIFKNKNDFFIFLIFVFHLFLSRCLKKTIVFQKK